MNERIRQLAEQTFYYGNWEGDGVYTGQVDLEKFAELIVNKCINLIRADYVDLGTTAAVNNIEKYFGVE